MLKLFEFQNISLIILNIANFTLKLTNRLQHLRPNPRLLLQQTLRPLPVLFQQIDTLDRFFGLFFNPVDIKCKLFSQFIYLALDLFQMLVLIPVG